MIYIKITFPTTFSKALQGAKIKDFIETVPFVSYFIHFFAK
jgi:hypothetical protein